MVRSPAPLQLYWQLVAKVDALSARVAARYAPELACAPGCADCCQVHLRITAVEAAAIAQYLEALPRERRDTVRARASEALVAATPACPALAADGRCGIYAARPFVCRSHGLPIRNAVAADGVVSVCKLNFRSQAGSAALSVDADCVLDQTTLSTVLAAIDAALADAERRPRGGRVELAELLTAADPHSFATSRDAT